MLEFLARYRLRLKPGTHGKSLRSIAVMLVHAGLLALIQTGQSRELRMAVNFQYLGLLLFSLTLYTLLFRAPIRREAEAAGAA